MADRLLPAGSNSYLPAQSSPNPVTQYGGEPGFDEQGEGGGFSFDRILAALKRHRWLILAMGILGAVGGTFASKFVHPTYQVQGTVWINAGPRDGRPTGAAPIAASELLPTGSWPDLISSYAILDKTVRKLRTFVWTKKPEDAPILAGLEITDRLVPGEYTLEVEGQRWQLLNKKDSVVEAGAVGDSIGRRIGLQWRPEAAQLRDGREATFTVITPRDAAVGLQRRLVISLPERSNIMTVRLTDRNPEMAARTLNMILDEFVASAGDLKKRNVVELAKTLQSQLQYAEAELRSAEGAMQAFGVSNATTPLGGGLSLSGDPVTNNYFATRVEYENVRSERAALERTLTDIRGGTLDPNALWSLAAQPGTGKTLEGVLGEYVKTEAELRAQQQIYTDEFKGVQDLKRKLDLMRKQVIPRAVGSSVEQMRRREADLQNRIGSATGEVRSIPAKQVEDARLKRQVALRASLYENLRQRYEEARLGAASAAADVTVLDHAVTPMFPSSPTGPSLVLLGVLASLLVGAGLAVLLDRLDKKIRYPEQVIKELGLPILGAVPAINQGKKGEADPEEAAQLVESFRSLRLGITHVATGVGSVRVTVTSPAAGDGKSLVASNLALSFAEAGYRTLLLDGDIRRGRLHGTFGVDRRPGLIDYLAGEAILEDVIRRTGHERLDLLPSGARRHRGPELLVSGGVDALFDTLRLRYDAIIVDSPPLGAGSDAYVLGANTGNMVVVIRMGATNRKLAKAKLRLLDMVPVTVLGAVLNHIGHDKIYENYSYIHGYAEEEDEPVAELPAPEGAVVTTR